MAIPKKSKNSDNLTDAERALQAQYNNDEYVASLTKETSNDADASFDDPYAAYRAPGEDPSYSYEIDVEKGTLKPFDSDRKSKRKKTVSTKDFDARRNLAKRENRIRTAVVIIMVILLGLAIYQTVVPKHIPDQAEIKAIAQQAVNKTKFPASRAKIFAENYVSAYVRINADEDSNKLLSYYTTGSDEKNSVNSTGRSYSGQITQYDIVSAKADDGVSLGDNSGSFLVTAYVRPSVTNQDANTLKEKTASEKMDEGKWVSFRVNVFWDEKTNGFAIAGTPTLMPATNVIPSNDVPKAKELGKLDNTATNKVQGTVTSFMKAYAAASPEDSTGLQQYITANADTSLKTGMRGKFTFGNTASNKGGINIEAYIPEGSNNDDVLIVKTTVDWVDAIEAATSDQATQPRITYQSTYILTMVKQADGKYQVSKMTPEVYTPDADALNDYKNK